MSRVFPEQVETKETIAGRIWRLIDRPMSIETIELKYVAKYGQLKHETLLAELHNLEAARKINRIYQGLYEP